MRARGLVALALPLGTCAPRGPSFEGSDVTGSSFGLARRSTQARFTRS